MRVASPRIASIKPGFWRIRMIFGIASVNPRERLSNLLGHVAEGVLEPLDLLVESAFGTGHAAQEEIELAPCCGDVLTCNVGTALGQRKLLLGRDNSRASFDPLRLGSAQILTRTREGQICRAP